MYELDLGFAGTLLGALIGALALLIIARNTASQIHANFRADKLAEAKRDVFLRLVDCWMSYLLDIHSYKLHQLDEYREIVFQSNKAFVSSLHKSSFISEPITKKEIMEFTFYLSLKNFEITSLINNWYNSDENLRLDLEFQLMTILEDLGNRSLGLQKKLRAELGIENDPHIDEYLNKIQAEFSNKVKHYLFNRP